MRRVLCYKRLGSRYEDTFRNCRDGSRVRSSIAWPPQRSDRALLRPLALDPGSNWVAKRALHPTPQLLDVCVAGRTVAT